MYNFSNQIAHVGISACLLGQEVRFDGGHKRSEFCADDLARHVKYVALCPEVAIGLGTPRPTIRLERHDDNIIARTTDKQDVTQDLSQYGVEQGTQLGFLSGYVFCANSPSCGMERVRIYQGDSKHHSKTGVGLYAAELMKALPLLPVEENGRLNDPLLRENFITRVFAYHDWQCLQHSGVTAAKMVDFHSRYKYLLMAHDRQSYQQLGRLLSDLSANVEVIAQDYIKQLMHTLKKLVTRQQHTNVLQHLQGYFKHQLSASEKHYLTHTIEQYRLGTLPLLAPITLLLHHLAEHPDPYLSQQQYLHPHPQELRLRYAI